MSITFVLVFSGSGQSVAAAVAADVGSYPPVLLTSTIIDVQPAKYRKITFKMDQKYSNAHVEVSSVAAGAIDDGPRRHLTAPLII